jgi:hypothetical protein
VSRSPQNLDYPGIFPSTREEAQLPERFVDDDIAKYLRGAGLGIDLELADAGKADTAIGSREWLTIR